MRMHCCAVVGRRSAAPGRRLGIWTERREQRSMRAHRRGEGGDKDGEAVCLRRRRRPAGRLIKW